MNPNKRTKNCPSMNCSCSLHTRENTTNETKVALQLATNNIQSDMECTKKCMEFARIMLSYSYDKMKSLESQITQMKCVIDANNTGVPFSSENEQRAQNYASTPFQGIISDSAFNSIEGDDHKNIFGMESGEQESGGSRIKEIRTPYRKKVKFTMDGSKQAEETATRRMDCRFPAFNDITISDDFITIDSPEREINTNKKVRLSARNRKKVAKAQKTRGSNHTDFSGTETVDLDNQPSTSRSVTLADATNDTDTEAVRMAVQKTKGILPSDELLTYLYLSRQVDDPVELANSFTKDIKLFYFQLLTFAFHLRDINEVLEQEGSDPPVDHRLEERLRLLTDVFESELQPETK